MTALIKANVSELKYWLQLYATPLSRSYVMRHVGVNERCECRSDRDGNFCEFDKPCPMLATEKAEKIGEFVRHLL